MEFPEFDFKYGLWEEMVLRIEITLTSIAL